MKEMGMDRRGSGCMMNVGMAALAAALAVGLPAARAEGAEGGLAFDFRKLSAERYPEDSSGVDLATNKWKHSSFIHLSSSRITDAERAKLARAVESMVEYSAEGGVYSLRKPPRLLEVCSNDWSVIGVASSCFAQAIDLPDDKGGTYRVSMRYRTSYRVRRGSSDLQVYDARGPKDTYPYIWHLMSNDLEWNYYTRDFKVAPGTRRFTVYMRSYGYGDLSFKDFRVTKLPESRPAAYPVEILNTPHGYLGHTFAVSRGQPGILHYQWRALDAVKRDMGKFEFRLTVPKGFGLVDIMFADDRGWRKTDLPDGSCEYRFGGAGSAPAASFNTWFRFGVMIDSSAPEGTEGDLVLSASYEGRQISNEEKMKVFVIPEIKVSAPSPEVYMNGFHQASDSGFRSKKREVNLRYAKFMYDCGARLAKCSHGLVDVCREVGFPRIILETKVANGFNIGFSEKAPPGEKYVPLNPAFPGAKHAVCPVSVYREKPFFATNTVPYLKEMLKKVDGIWANWEPYAYAEQGCMCDDCCREFARFLGLPYEDVRKDWPACIARRGRLGKDAIRFRSWQHGELVKTVNRYVVDFTGGPKSMGFCIGVEHGQMMSNWRETNLYPEAAVKDYGSSLRWLEPWGPYSGVWDVLAPYVYSPGLSMLDYFNALDIRASADRDWPNAKLMSMPHGFQCSGCLTQPEWIEMNLDAYFFAKWNASLVYFFPCGYDARYWRAFANATATAAKYERYVRDGRRVDSLLGVKMADDFPPPIKTAQPNLWASGASFPNFSNPLLLQTIAWQAKDGRRIVAAFNFREDGPANCTLSFSDRKVSRAISVPAARCVVVEFDAPPRGDAAPPADAARGSLSLAGPFADGAVLQRGRPVPVWGFADEGDVVKVAFAGLEASATAGGTGRWRVDLPAMKECGKGRDLVVSAAGRDGAPKGTVTVRDVLVGDVWFACGQSNMDCPLVGPSPRYRDGQGVAMAATTRLPEVRWCRAPAWKWKSFAPETLSPNYAISAVAFYFAREVHLATGVPLGLVCAHTGGTNIEQWTPKSGFEKTGLFPELRDWVRIPEKSFTTNNYHGAIRHWAKQPFMSFEGWLEPCAPYAMTGVVWYQGEQNAGYDRDTYDLKLHALLTGLETEFENPGLKFYMVQIPRPCSNPQFQESQARFVKRHAADGRVKMAVISDIANVHEVHPAEKEPVGRRLAYLALRHDYGFTGLEAESPEPLEAKASSNRVTVTFSHAKTLTVYNASLSFDSRFELAGADGVFRPAAIVNPLVTKSWGKEFKNGELEGACVVLEAAGVDSPKAVRYLHSRPYTSNVFNESGLPLGAFSMQVSPPPVRAVAYGPSFRDRLWMWGHHKEFTLRRRKDGTPSCRFLPCQEGMDMAEACRYMGIPNCCVVLYTPQNHVLEDFVSQFSDMKRVAWSIGETDVGTLRERIDRVYKASESVPGLRTMYLDDYFVKKMGCTWEIPQLKSVKEEISARGYKLACVLYSDQDGLKEEFLPHIAECDEVSYWFWRQANLDGLEKSVRDCRAFIGEEKSLLLGVYMYEFAGDTKLMPPELMRRQLDVAERLMSDATIDGIIFHCTPICNSGAEAIAISRDWISRHGDDVWGAKRGADAK